MGNTIDIKTLKDVIKEAFTQGKGKEEFGRNPSEWERSSEYLEKWFRSYYSGKVEKNDSRKKLLKNNVLSMTIDDIKKDTFGFFTHIRDGISSFPKNDKLSPALKIRHLFRYLNEKYNLDLEPEFIDQFRQPDKNMRLIEILKLLHKNNISRSELVETFEISERTLNEDLRALRDGINILGNQIKVDGIEHMNKEYISPNHPIFLTLNSPEIYALTIGMKLLSKDTVFESPMQKIADQIYSQLSSFGKEMVDKKGIEVRVKFNHSDLKFTSSIDIAHQNNKAFCNYLRDSRLCEVHYSVNGENYVTLGTLHLAIDEKDMFTKVEIRGAEKREVININDIDLICPVHREAFPHFQNG